MIQNFIENWENRKASIRAIFEAAHPESYAEIVKAVVEVVGADIMDKSRITQVRHGGDKGTLLYVIAAERYQPDEFWFVKVGYGSCSGCDTLEAIRRYDSGKPTEKQVEQYMTLALHIVQGLKELGGEAV